MSELCAEQVSRLQECDEPQRRLQLLAQSLGLAYPGPTRENSILADFHYYNLSFALEQSFTNRQILVFLRGMQTVFEQAMAQTTCSVQESFKAFKGVFIAEAAAAGGKGADDAVFSLHDITLITDFVSESFYRHFTAYWLCFRNVTGLETKQHPATKVETPLRPPSLGAATTATPRD